MSDRATSKDVGQMLQDAFPGIRITSADRTREKQAALVAAGKTRATNSQHISGTALDVVLPRNVKPSQVATFLRTKGIDPSEFLNETGKGRNQGTGAHLHIGWGARRSASQRAAAPSAPSRGQSTYDRIRARRPASEGSPLTRIYAAYRQGKMTPEQAAQFENDVGEGAILLPPGGKLKKTPAAPVVPAGVVRAYNDMESGMTVADRQQLDQDMRDGIVSLPRGAKLNPWRPMTTGENMRRSLEIGGRAVIEGVGEVGGIIMNPLNMGLNATGLPQKITGAPLPMANDPSVNLADKLGLAKPQFDGEKMTSAITRGATGGMATYGLGSLAAGLPGAVGIVGRGLASAPIADVASGGVSGGSADAARQMGFGPVGQTVAALAGGGTSVAGTIGAKAVTSRVGARRAADLPAATPREVVIDRAGELTEEGQELVARHGFTPDEIKAAYDTPAEPQPAAPQDAAPRDAVAAGSGESAPAPVGVDPRVAAAEQRVQSALNDVGRAGGRVDLQDGETISLSASRPTRADPEALAAAEQELATARQDLSAAREAVAADGPVTPPRAVPSEVEAAPLPAPVAAADEAVVPPPGASVGARGPAERMADAESVGIPLSRGQATQDFATQDSEQTLRAQASGEGERARSFLTDQAEKIKTAVTRFRESFGPADASKAERGETVKAAIRELRDQGKSGITALYREAEAMGGNALALDQAGIVDAAKRVLVEADVPDAVKNVVRQEMARHQMIGKDAVTAEDGLTTVKLSDGRKVQFYGDPQPLTVANAEQFRKAISAQYVTDGPRKLSQSIKGALDDAVEAAIEAAARNGVDGPVGAKLKEARKAVVTQKETFAAKDVVQSLIDWKKGTRTDVVLPENAVRTILAGEATNLRKVKAILLSKPTVQSKAAWRAIQAEGVGGIFDKAYTANANLGAGQMGTISGAKLNSEIIRIGLPKLKVLLDEPDLARLMVLRRVIGEATIPVSGTTNPSGTAFKLMRFLAPMAVKFSGLPLVGPAIDVASGLVKQAKATAEAQRTLSGMTEYSASAARREGSAKARGAVRSTDQADVNANGFLDALASVAREGRLASTLLASQAQAFSGERGASD